MPLVVHLIDGTYELFRQFYGIRRAKGEDPPFGAVSGVLHTVAQMIEGGATVNWTALAANVVDKVFLYYAPKILAGTGSIPFAAGPGFHHMNSAAQVRHLHLHRFGEDFAVEGYLRDPYGE